MSHRDTNRVALQARLEEALAGRVPAVVATLVKGEPLGAKVLLLPDETMGTLGNAVLDATVEPEARALLVAEKSETRTYQLPGRDEAVEVFIESYPPPPTLLIFGAVHVAQPLSRFAKALGFDVIVSDARAKLATRERFPEADRIIRGWPDETLEQVEILPNTPMSPSCLTIPSSMSQRWLARSTRRRRTSGRLAAARRTKIGVAD